jgi:hypothetical protein
MGCGDTEPAGWGALLDGGKTMRARTLAAIGLALSCAACAGLHREESLMFSPAVQARLDEKYSGLGTRLAELLEIQRHRRWDALTEDLLSPADTHSVPAEFLAKYPSWYSSKLVDLSVDTDQFGAFADDEQSVAILACGKYKDYAVPQYLTTTIVAVHRDKGWCFYPPDLHIPIDGSPEKCKP